MRLCARLRVRRYSESAWALMAFGKASSSSTYMSFLTCFCLKPAAGLLANTKNRRQDWTLDRLGNWDSFKEDGGAWTLEQARTHNKVNEITDITETAGPACESSTDSLTQPGMKSGEGSPLPGPLPARRKWGLRFAKRNLTTPPGHRLKNSLTIFGTVTRQQNA